MFKVVSAKQGLFIFDQLEIVLQHHLQQRGWQITSDCWYSKGNKSGLTMREALEREIAIEADEALLLGEKPA